MGNAAYSFRLSRHPLAYSPAFPLILQLVNYRSTDNRLYGNHENRTTPGGFLGQVSKTKFRSVLLDRSIGSNEILYDFSRHSLAVQEFFSSY